MTSSDHREAHEKDMDWSVLRFSKLRNIIFHIMFSLMTVLGHSVKQNITVISSKDE